MPGRGIGVPQRLLVAWIARALPEANSSKLQLNVKKPLWGGNCRFFASGDGLFQTPQKNDQTLPLF